MKNSFEYEAELAALREELAKTEENRQIIASACTQLIAAIGNKDMSHSDALNSIAAAEQRNAALVQKASKAFESAARWVESRRDDYVNDHGSLDPETGTVGLPGNGEEYVCELDEIAEGLRALKPTESGASE